MPATVLLQRESPIRIIADPWPSPVRNNAGANHKLSKGSSEHVLSFSSWRHHAETFGSVFKKARLQAGLSQIELAETVGVNPTTVMRWEGRTLTPMRRNVKLAEACEEVGVSQLIDRDGHYESTVACRVADPRSSHSGRTGKIASSDEPMEKTANSRI